MKKGEAKRKREGKKQDSASTSKRVKTEKVLPTEEEQDDIVVMRDESEYGSLLPKFYYDIDASVDDNSYYAIINIKQDGFRGYSALAHQLFGNQGDFFRVKFAVRDKLIEVEETYSTRPSFPTSKSMN